jgi:hypothetical protein
MYIFIYLFVDKFKYVYAYLGMRHVYISIYFLKIIQFESQLIFFAVNNVFISLVRIFCFHTPFSIRFFASAFKFAFHFVENQVIIIIINYL